MPFILDIIFAKYTINPTLIHHQKTRLVQPYFMNSVTSKRGPHTWTRHRFLQSEQILQKIPLLAKLISICDSWWGHFFPWLYLYFKTIPFCSFQPQDDSHDIPLHSYLDCYHSCPRHDEILRDSNNHYNKRIFHFDVSLLVLEPLLKNQIS